MKILIIGSKGFIGSHAFSFFNSLDYNVFGCDVVVDYNDPKYFQVDASNSDFTEIFRKTEFNICINCSGAASVPDSMQRPQRDFQLNVVNVAKLLETIRNYSPLCKFLNLSSAAVYGNPPMLPINESAPMQPISPYGLHKEMAEQLCAEYHDYFNINTCNLRIFSAYGPGLKKQLFWDLYQKSKSNIHLELFGTGEETRDFIFIDDIIIAIDIVVRVGEFNGEVLNLASGREVRISDAVKLFFEALKWDGTYSFQGEGREGDPKRWCADISELKNLGFEVKYELKTGLIKYIEWLPAEERK
ncbi:NAD(P)-dependent oxidoreductase [Marivirga sp.]|uniref:NAD-dependent epimerase/dehydratase family protein n=1 Tax=Marivirga sp. TaxID=2018662 RepID=UPI0025F7770F|nr:SDR family oxidoreductase [Marivirga sp.]